MKHHSRFLVCVLIACGMSGGALADEGVYNGSFEKTVAGGRTPDGWQAAGDKAVVQELSVEQAPTRGHVARLGCTRFVPGTPSSHAMIAQFGHVAVRGGRWYRLSLWARAADLEAGVVQLNLVNFRGWSSAGLTDHFVPTDSWQHFEIVFRAERDLKAAERPYAVLAGRRGFFRVRWEPDGGLAQSLRCAVIEPCREGDAVLGFNHAFGQDFLLPLAHAAGLRWWRDWSVQWDAVQPKRDAAFDFRLPDVQIRRVLDRGGRMVVLLPYPSAGWSADPKQAESLRRRQAKGELSGHDLRQALAASKPERLEDFARYVRATVEHFRGRVGHYEILNEPLYTHYALPSAAYGASYKTPDYLDVLRTAYQAAKAADPQCTVIGGIACGPGSQWEDQFISQGGMRWCDVTNYHLYPSRQRAEAAETAFRMSRQQMQQRGEAKPIWVTEFGLYGEDDPAVLPAHAGDSTMDNALRPDERTAASDLVQWVAVMFAHGVEKVFFHAGTCQGFHASSTGNMFFEYGGAPRKMYPAVAVVARLLGPDFQFVRKWEQPEWLSAYEFRSQGQTVAILWTRKANAPKWDVPGGFQVLDLMGNPIEVSPVAVGETPLYLVGKQTKSKP